jgi:hypothetical protein
MMTQESLAELARQIMAQGYDLQKAALYAALIGDLPIADGKGNLIVRDERGREIDRIKTPPMFE